MKSFEDVLRERSFAFWARGAHAIMPDAFVDRLVRGEAVLLDLRSEEEVAHLAFPGALHIPLEQLPDRWQEVPRDKLVAAFCPGGSRSILAQAYLEMKGYTNVRVLRGGYAGITSELVPPKLGRRLREA
ncbi:MAG: rhodanese-like domain-containing protein [Chloroflexi bacterium]|nr:rhodanese-like domain-containing protein [Chloroflexota bacterium]